MKKDSQFDVERGERAYYFEADWTTPIRIPTTYDGLEALIERVAKWYDRPVTDFDDDVRSGICGYIHSLDRTENMISFETLAKVMWRAMGMKLTWVINETLRLEKIERVEAAKNKMKEQGLAKKLEKKSNKYSVKRKSDEAEAN